MDVHEYQAKELLASFGVAVPKGAVAFSADQAVYAATELGGSFWAVKAQIHAGARGKAGGIKLCRTYNEVRDAARELLGKRLVTLQTGPEGKPVQRVYVETADPFERELYLGYVLDRKAERVRVIASQRGGMDIEEIAATEPEALIQVVVEPAVGLQQFQAREIAFQLGLNIKQVSAAVKTIMNAYRAFRDCDGTMLEINPLVVTKDDRVLALDAKMSFDDNAMFRRRNIADMHDPSQGDPREAQAAEHNLSYIGLEGEIGCIVNGAGLAMATMDMIKHAGGEPRELPRRRRRREPRARRHRLPARPVGQEREGDPRQHLRRHQPLRLGRRGRGPGGARGEDRGAADRPAGRHERRGRPEDPRRERPRPDHRRDPVGSRPEGRRGLPRHQALTSVR